MIIGVVRRNQAEIQVYVLGSMTRPGVKNHVQVLMEVLYHEGSPWFCFSSGSRDVS